MQLSKEVQVKLKKFVAKFGIKFIVLFGSQVKGSNGNDFDIAIALNNHRSIWSKVGLYSKILEVLEDILEISYDKIDLSDLNEANIFLRYEITKDGKLLYGDELDYLEVKSFAMRDYIDARDLRELEELLIKKRHVLISEAING